MDMPPPPSAGVDYADTGGYPIGVVASLTGLSVALIRAWERRYGVPRPARSAGQHRLYSPRDVALLRRAAALRAQGLAAAAACAQALAEATPAAPTAPSGVVATTDAAGDLSARLLDAVEAMDAGRVSALLAETAALLDVESAWERILAPVFRRLGEGWERRGVTAGPEHLLSVLVRGRLTTLLEAMPRIPAAPTVVIGAAPGEQHDLASLMLALMLARAGWQVTFLGAETPQDAMAAAARAVRADVVVISATTPECADAGLESLRQIRDRAHGWAPALAYGGPAFVGRAVQDEDGRDLTPLPADLRSASQQLARLVTSGRRS